MEASKRPTPVPGSDLAAIHLATAGLESAITRLVLRTSSQGRHAVMDCIMTKMSKLMEELEECQKLDTFTAPVGPDCPKGFIPVGEYCIPEG
jgi:hypothetical protein